MSTTTVGTRVQMPFECKQTFIEWLAEKHYKKGNHYRIVSTGTALIFEFDRLIANGQNSLDQLSQFCLSEVQRLGDQSLQIRKLKKKTAEQEEAIAELTDQLDDALSTFKKVRSDFEKYKEQTEKEKAALREEAKKPMEELMRIVEVRWGASKRGKGFINEVKKYL